MAPHNDGDVIMSAGFVSFEAFILYPAVLLPWSLFLL